jgi:hypothetical protein
MRMKGELWKSEATWSDVPDANCGVMIEEGKLEWSMAMGSFEGLRSIRMWVLEKDSVRGRRIVEFLEREGPHVEDGMRILEMRNEQHGVRLLDYAVWGNQGWISGVDVVFDDDDMGDNL